MDASTPPQSEEDWTVTISVHERDGRTRATARLKFGDHESVGVGLSRLSPAERGLRRHRQRTGRCAGGVGSRAAADGPYLRRRQAQSSSRLCEFNQYRFHRCRHSRGNRRRKADAVIDVNDADA